MNKPLISTLFCALVTLAGCSSTPIATSTNSSQDSAFNNNATSSSLCNSDPVQSLLGKNPNPSVMAQAKQLSGAKQLRTLLPGQVMTMEYNPERLNILVDDADTITRINCG
ncbi:hypothetical protein H0A58_10585 [Alcaligenaceae bacterium]|nr:hypothetical protein [Alcaligenaceae bacterium]